MSATQGSDPSDASSAARSTQGSEAGSEASLADQLLAGGAGLDAVRQRELRLWLGCVALMGLLGWLGIFGFARLVNDLPLLLIVLSPLNRHLILIAPTVGAAEFIAVALPRMLLSCLVAFKLGRAVGPAGLEWLDGNSPAVSRFIRWIERLFARSAVAALLIWPGFAVALLAGVSGMRAAPTLLLCAVGLAIRLTLILQLGQALMEPIQWLLSMIDAHWKEVTLLTILVWAGVQAYRRIRNGRGGGAVAARDGQADGVSSELSGR